MWKISNISVKGVLGGIGFDVIASIILSVVVALAFTYMSDISIENQNEYQLAFESSFNVRLALLIGGLLIAFGMGFVAEWLAPIASLINATICGGALLLFNIFFVYFNPEAAPNWSQIVIIIGVLPLSILGGWVVVANKNT